MYDYLINFTTYTQNKNEVIIGLVRCTYTYIYVCIKIGEIIPHIQENFITAIR